MTARNCAFKVFVDAKTDDLSAEFTFTPKDRDRPALAKNFASAVRQDQSATAGDHEREERRSPAPCRRRSRRPAGHGRSNSAP